MSIRITITDEEIDVLTDLLDGDSVNDPGDWRYPILAAFINRVFARDTRPVDVEGAIARNERAHYDR